MSKTTHASSAAVSSAPPCIIANDQLVLLPLDILQIDSRYQRSIVQRHVNKIREFFDRRILTPPIVVQRPDGSYWVIDGQQRITALRTHSAGFTHVWVQVIKATEEEEAELFVRVNSGSKILSAVELFKASYFRGTNVAVTIEKNLNDAGLTAMTKETRREVRAIGKMLEAWGPSTPVYKHYDTSKSGSIESHQFKDGAAVHLWAIQACLPLIKRNWPANEIYNGNVIAALIWIRRTRDKTSLSAVKKALSRVESPGDLRRIVTKINGSAGGSRRDLQGVRLAHWINQVSDAPFIALRAEEWELLRINDGVDVERDPAILVLADDDSEVINFGNVTKWDPAALVYLNEDEFAA